MISTKKRRLALNYKPPPAFCDYQVIIGHNDFITLTAKKQVLLQFLRCSLAQLGLVMGIIFRNTLPVTYSIKISRLLFYAGVYARILWKRLCFHLN